MKKTILIDIALLLITAVALPGNASGASALLQVTGVVRPSACTATLQGAGVIDYADIGYDSLSQTEPNRLDPKDVDLTILCSAPARVGIRTIDNRSASKAILPTISDHGAMYGLGATGTARIGAYHLAIRKLEGDNLPLEALTQASPGSITWARNHTGTVRPEQTVSWGPAGSSTIGAYQHIVATLSVTPVLNRASALPAGQAISLDGAATIEIVYL